MSRHDENLSGKDDFVFDDDDEWEPDEPCYMVCGRGGCTGGGIWFRTPLPLSDGRRGQEQSQQRDSAKIIPFSKYYNVEEK